MRDVDGAGLGLVGILAPLETELRARVSLALVLDRLEPILACMKARLVAGGGGGSCEESSERTARHVVA